MPQYLDSGVASYEMSPLNQSLSPFHSFSLKQRNQIKSLETAKQCYVQGALKSLHESANRWGTWVKATLLIKLYTLNDIIISIVDPVISTMDTRHQQSRVGTSMSYLLTPSFKVPRRNINRPIHCSVQDGVNNIKRKVIMNKKFLRTKRALITGIIVLGAVSMFPMRGQTDGWYLYLNPDEYPRMSANAQSVVFWDEDTPGSSRTREIIRSEQTEIRKMKSMPFLPKSDRLTRQRIMAMELCFCGLTVPREAAGTTGIWFSSSEVINSKFRTLNVLSLPFDHPDGPIDALQKVLVTFKMPEGRLDEFTPVLGRHTAGRPDRLAMAVWGNRNEDFTRKMMKAAQRRDVAWADVMPTDAKRYLVQTETSPQEVIDEAQASASSSSADASREFLGQVGKAFVVAAAKKVGTEVGKEVAKEVIQQLGLPF